jgi:hypothetical protein
MFEMQLGYKIKKKSAGFLLESLYLFKRFLFSFNKMLFEAVFFSSELISHLIYFFILVFVCTVN